MILKGLRSRFTEQRNVNNPNTSLSDPAAWLWEALGARKTATGLAVTPDSSLESTTVWAAVRMISSTVATLPLPVFRETDAGKERAKQHPAYALLHDRPNPEMSSFVFREVMMAHLLLYGNFYAEIERNGRGDPVALWPLMPVNVRWQRVGDRKVYIVRVNNEDVALASDNVLHIAGFSLDGQTGLLPTTYARNAIGLSRATEEYGSSFFANGASPSGILTHPNKLGKDGADNLRASWAALHGGLTNAQRVAILEEGMTWSPLGIPPEHAQFLETRKFQVSEVARLFLIPPHLIADLERATFSNIEHQGQQYVTYCIEPWTRRIEQELNYKLFADRMYFAAFILEGLLRGDSQARGQFYKTMREMGVYSVNEIREREGLNWVEGGDSRLVPLNMQPLGAGQEAQHDDL